MIVFSSVSRGVGSLCLDILDGWDGLVGGMDMWVDGWVFGGVDGLLEWIDGFD